MSQELIDAIIVQVNAWLPTFVAICGVLASVILAINKVTGSINAQTEIHKRSENEREIELSEIRNLIKQYRALREDYDNVLSALTRIEHYGKHSAEAGNDKKV